MRRLHRRTAFYSLAENQPPIFGLSREAVLQPGRGSKQPSLGYVVWSGDVRDRNGGARPRNHPVLGVESLPRNWWITPARIKRMKNKKKAWAANREIVPEIKSMYRQWAKENWTNRAQKIETIERVLEDAQRLGPKKGLQKGDQRFVLKKFKPMREAQAEKEWYAARKRERAQSRTDWKKRKQQIAEGKRVRREEERRRLEEERKRENARAEESKRQEENKLEKLKATRRGLANRLRTVLTSSSIDTQIMAQARRELQLKAGVTGDLVAYIKGNPDDSAEEILDKLRDLFSKNIDKESLILFGLTGQQIIDNLVYGPVHKALSVAQAYATVGGASGQSQQPKTTPAPSDFVNDLEGDLGRAVGDFVKSAGGSKDFAEKVFFVVEGESQAAVNGKVESLAGRKSIVPVSESTETESRFAFSAKSDWLSGNYPRDEVQAEITFPNNLNVFISGSLSVKSIAMKVKALVSKEGLSPSKPAWGSLLSSVVSELKSRFRDSVSQSQDAEKTDFLLNESVEEYVLSEMDVDILEDIDSEGLSEREQYLEGSVYPSSWILSLKFKDPSVTIGDIKFGLSYQIKVPVKVSGIRGEWNVD